MSKGEISLFVEEDPKAIHTINDIPPAVMQAIYREATQRTEKIVKPFFENFEFSRDSVEQLVHLVIQTQQQFDVKATTLRIEINQDKHGSVQCSSLEKFLQYNVQTPYPIDTISISWKFLLAIPLVEGFLGEKKYHEYQLVVRLESFILPQKGDTRYDFFEMGALDSISNYPSIKASVDYVDYVVARTFITTVEEWAKTLPTRPKRKLLSAIYGRRFDLLNFVPALIGVSTLSTTPSLWGLIGTRVGGALALPVWMSSQLAFFFTSQILSQIVLTHFIMRMKLINNHPLILVNSGDQKNKKEVDAAVAASPVRLAAAVASVVFQIALNIVASYAFEALKKG